MNTDYIIIGLLAWLVIQDYRIDRSIYYGILNIPRKVRALFRHA